ncbi:hypothetical protein BKP56_12150 [Marinilactibacillus sp. 15R]|nr:hypothetical protein BKP56_12150 [Marinilactibacillus sp. 15R]
MENNGLIKKLQEQNGFTLIESLIVLSLVGIFLLIPVIPFNKMEADIENSLFFEELQSSITLLQNESVLNDEWTEIEMRPNAREIVFRVIGKRNHILNRSIALPDTIEILGGSKVYRFLSESGNQGNLNKTRFQVGDKFYTLSFKLGSGRFELSEEK